MDGGCEGLQKTPHIPVPIIHHWNLQQDITAAC